MIQSLADHLRVLDRAATPGKWRCQEVTDSINKYDKHFMLWANQRGLFRSKDLWAKAEDAELIIALRTLLPALADVVEAASDWQNPTFVIQLKNALDNLAAAVAAVEGGR